MNTHRRFNLDPDSDVVATTQEIEPFEDDIPELEYLSFDKDDYDPLDEKFKFFEELDFEDKR